MKKKLILGFAAAMFAAITMVNINLAMKAYNNDVSLESIAVMAQAAVDEVPHWPSPGAIGKTERCRLHLGGNWYTSSVERVCLDNYVCTSCKCKSYACGEVFFEQ